MEILKLLIVSFWFSRDMSTVICCTDIGQFLVPIVKQQMQSAADLISFFTLWIISIHYIGVLDFFIPGDKSVSVKIYKQKRLMIAEPWQILVVVLEGMLGNFTVCLSKDIWR